MRRFLLAGILLFTKIAWGQVQQLTFTNFPVSVLEKLPGLQQTAFLVDAQEEDGTAGYLVFQVDKQTFANSLDLQAKQLIEENLDQFGARKSSCRLTRRVVDFEINSSRSLNNGPDFNSLIFDYTYNLIGKEENLKWEWRGFHSGLHWIKEPPSTLIRVTLRSNLDFFLNAITQELIFSERTLGDGRIFYKNCWCIGGNPIYNKCTPHERNIPRNTDSPLDINDPTAEIFREYLNITETIGIKTDENLIYIYLSLKK